MAPASTHESDSITSSPLGNKEKEDSSNGPVEKESPLAVQLVDPVDDIALLSDEERKIGEAKIKRLLDMRLLPITILIFLMNYIDRTAITSARLQGIQEDLHLSDIQYETVIAILYVSPSLYIGTCVVLWGLTSCLTGVTQNFAGIICCRVFIGLPEAAFYPGCMYLLSRWYTKKELSFRGAILYGGLLISNAFGSLIAAGILNGMDGLRGIRAWRWLFYIEGCITICIGFLSMWALPDYPHNTRWMNPAQRRLAQVRLAEDAGEADEDAVSDSPWEGFRLAMKDPKVPIFALMTVTQLLGLSFVNFFPTLTATLGFNPTLSLLLAAPPWILATIVCCVNAWNADRTGERYFHITGPWWGVVIGYIIGLSTMSFGGRYVCMFLMASGYAGFALTLVWVSNAIPRPPAKRAVAMGIVNGVGNLGNLIGSFVWKASWGPKYHPAMIISLVSLAFACFCAYIIRVILVRENKAFAEEELKNIDEAERMRIADAAKLEGITFEEALERKRGFRYLY